MEISLGQTNNLKQLDTASFFDKNTLQRVVKVTNNALYRDIKRWLRNGQLIQLKRGLYVTGNYYQNVPDKQTYLEFIANQLKYPSYLSLEYVLQKYSVLSESVYTITSVSRKKTKSFKNQLGLFTYAKIKDDLFTGFKVVNKSGFEIKEASKAKALFDWLYFRTRRVPQVNEAWLSSLRLNLEELTEEDFVELKIYIGMEGGKKLKKVYKLVKKTLDYDF